MGPVPAMLGAMLLLAPVGAARADDAPDVTILSAYRSLAGANERPRLRLTPASTSRPRWARRFSPPPTGRCRC